MIVLSNAVTPRDPTPWRLSASRELLDGWAGHPGEIRGARRNEGDGGASSADRPASFDLTCIHDLDGRILSANAAAARILGLDADHLTTLNVRSLLLQEERRLRFDAYLAALQSDGVASGTVSVLARDGRVRVWEYRSTLQTVGPHAPVVLGVARDVTSHQELLSTASRSEQHFRSIIENASDLIALIDPDGLLAYYSPSVERLLGCSASELTSVRLPDLVHPEDRLAVAELIQRHSAGLDDDCTSRLRMRDRSGAWRTLEMVVKNRWRDGRVHSMIITARDVTERLLLEAQLQQAQRLTGLGHVAATIAHEFNNVLMGILPFAELMQSPRATPAVLEKCGRYISSSVHRGKRVALDILRFTQPAVPVLKPVNLAEWCGTLAVELEAMIGNHITFTVSVPEDLVVMADTGQLAQVFVNLVNNARDAMPEEGALTISARAALATDRYSFGVVPSSETFVQISVTDTGTGIPADVLLHVFDPLFTTKTHGGTGLGLAVAHQVIARHQGYIFAESTVGAGCTFHMFLPSVDPVFGDVAGEGPRREVGAKRVLIVDDELPIVEGISELLSTSGFEVASVSTGGEAAEAMQRFDPDVVLLDLGLPDMDGDEVARVLRAIRPELPIIFATGHGDREQLGLDEFSRFLQKPFQFDTLLAVFSDLESLSRSTT